MLRFHIKSSIFSKVGIERKSVADMQMLHQGEPRTSDIGEVMIWEGFKNAVGFFDDFRCHTFALYAPLSDTIKRGYRYETVDSFEAESPYADREESQCKYSQNAYLG